MIQLIALIFPLALDTFAVSAALGMTGVSRRRRLGMGLLFAAFEGGMPLIGLLVGVAIGDLIAGVAPYIAAAALGGLGVYMLLADEKDEEARIARFATSRGWALAGVGLSVSLDELAIGFALGLSEVPIVPAIAIIAVQAFVASQLGFALGRRIGESVREGVERVAGIALIVIAIGLTVTTALGLRG